MYGVGEDSARLTTVQTSETSATKATKAPGGGPCVGSFSLVSNGRLAHPDAEPLEEIRLGR